MRVVLKNISRPSNVNQHFSKIETINNIQSKYTELFKSVPTKAFLKQRLQYFNQLKVKNDQMMAKYTNKEITIKLKDGNIIKGEAFKTTPIEIARNISRKIAENSIAVKIKYSNKMTSPYGKLSINTDFEQTRKRQEFEINGLNISLEGDCSIQFVGFQDEVGKQVFWHSSSHLLGHSLETVFGAWLCHGPPLENGFFYDSFLGSAYLNQSDYQQLTKQIKKYTQQKHQFERLYLSKQQALQMFSYNPFKRHLIETKVNKGEMTSVYKCGQLIDLCTGPHLPSTDRIKGYKIVKNSSAYWLGNKQNAPLQRIYGVSFPKQSQLDQYLKNQEQLLKRDHRTIGSKQGLFSFTPLSPGSALFLPHGTLIYNRLVDIMRKQYNIRGYKEVISPNLYNSELWKTSGHYFKYKQNIFFFKNDTEEQGLKPMNCPGHCLMFDQTQRSYRDLPIRLADFGVLHRNELAGALSGLTRVRRFQQDDAHIFCRNDQIQEEILGVLDLLDYMYSLFGFRYVLELSTRPEKYLGCLEDWEKAEQQLKCALKQFGRDFKINQGDGAFYGPKIDVKLFDAFGREHQCGTVQLDFQLPARFNLQYRSRQVKQQQKQTQSHPKVQNERKQKTPSPESQQHSKGCCHQDQTMQQMEKRYAEVKPLKNGFERPVMIHRAIFGSLERFIAILCEHNGGKWDFWISPRQIKLLTVGGESVQFAKKVQASLLLKNYSVQLDISSDNLGKKVRNAQIQGFNFIGVIGKQQSSKQCVNLRKRQQVIGQTTIPQLIELFESLQPEKSRKRKELQALSL